MNYIDYFKVAVLESDPIDCDCDPIDWEYKHVDNRSLITFKPA